MGLRGRALAYDGTPGMRDPKKVRFFLVQERVGAQGLRVGILGLRV